MGSNGLTSIRPTGIEFVYIEGGMGLAGIREEGLRYEWVDGPR